MPDLQSSSDSTHTFNVQITRYHIEANIGTGGMARVYRARDTVLDRTVAVKILHDHLSSDEVFRSRFEREAKFLAGLQHPNVIQIYDYAVVEASEGHLCYMVMTYLPNPPLKDIIDELHAKGERLEDQRVLQIINEVGSALQYAHKLGMVHRDVKPANILFDEHDRAILSDFGIARLVENSQLTQENVTIGTPDYMSPEQASGLKVDARTDIYALGVIMYEMLAGNPPFEGNTNFSVLLKHLQEPVPRLTDFDHIDNAELDAVISHALAKDADDRYQSVGAMVEELQQVLEGSQVIDAVKETVVKQPMVTDQSVVRKWQASTPLGILAAGIGIILIIISLAFVRSVVSNPAEGESDRVREQVQDAENTVGSMVDDNTVNSMVGDDTVPSMTDDQSLGFFSDFSENDPTVGVQWLVSDLTEDVFMEHDPTGAYIFQNSLMDRAATSIVEGSFYSTDIVIEATMQLDETSPPKSGYGIVFHHIDSDNYGVFAVDGVGQYSIWFLEDRTWRELREASENWTTNSVINPLGEVNHLRLETTDARLRGFVNDELVVDITDDSLTMGGVGLYLAKPRVSVTATLILDDYQVIVLDNLSVSSMTEDDQ